MKLIIDFDDVLIDNSKIKTAIFNALEKTGISFIDAQAHYLKVRSTKMPFSLKEFLGTFENVDVAKVYEDIMSTCKGLVNKELLEVVLSNGAGNVYIVTNGEEEYQKDKIKNSLGDVFQNIIIVPGSKNEVVEDLCKRFANEDVIFVDDKEEFFNDIDMEQCSNLKTVLWDERGLDKLISEIRR